MAVSDSLGTATMSPACASVAGWASLPRRSCSTCSRSSAWLRGLVSTVSGRIVPDSTRRSEILPTYGSEIVLNTRASGWPAGSQATSWVELAGLDLDRGSAVGARCDLRQERRQAVDADAGDGRAAHHREHEAVGHALGQGGFELLARRDVAVEVALHEGVVADDDPFDQLLAHLVLGGGEVVGDGAGLRLAPFVDDGACR